MNYNPSVGSQIHIPSLFDMLQKHNLLHLSNLEMHFNQEMKFDKLCPETKQGSNIRIQNKRMHDELFRIYPKSEDENSPAPAFYVIIRH